MNNVSLWTEWNGISFSPKWDDHIRERSNIMSVRSEGVGVGLSQNADTADAFEGGWGGLSQNADMLTLWREGVGQLKHRESITIKILEVINKIMNFFLNHAVIFLSTAPTHQNIFNRIIEKHILIIWNVSYNSSSNSRYSLLEVTRSRYMPKDKNISN